MVTRVNGAPYQGVWFSSGVRFVTVTIDTGTTAFLTDLRASNTAAQKAESVNSDLEQIIEFVATRGTVIGLNVGGDAVCTLMVDYGQAIDPLVGTTIGNQDATAVGAELEALVEGLATVTAATITVAEGFAGAALGTPA